MNSVEDLDVFKLAHKLALKAYAATRTFPREELFGLGSQIRRAAASVGMNLMDLALVLRTMATKIPFSSPVSFFTAAIFSSGKNPDSASSSSQYSLSWAKRRDRAKDL